MQAADTPPLKRIQDQLTTRLPLVWFSLAFLGGIVLASLVSLHIFVWIALFVLADLLIIVSRLLARRRPSLPFFVSPFFFVLLFALFLGAARYEYSVPRFNAFHIAFYNDRDYDMLVTGTLVEPPDYRDNYTNLRLEVTSVDTGDGDLPANGLLLARVSNNQTFRYPAAARQLEDAAGERGFFVPGLSRRAAYPFLYVQRGSDGAARQGWQPGLCRPV